MGRRYHFDLTQNDEDAWAVNNDDVNNNLFTI